MYSLHIGGPLEVPVAVCAATRNWGLPKDLGLGFLVLAGSPLVRLTRAAFVHKMPMMPMPIYPISRTRNGQKEKSWNPKTGQEGAESKIKKDLDLRRLLARPSYPHERQRPGQRKGKKKKKTSEEVPSTPLLPPGRPSGKEEEEEEKEKKGCILQATAEKGTQAISLLRLLLLLLLLFLPSPQSPFGVSMASPSPVPPIRP
ncbi:hypothetical protein B0T20DRAFT_72086 [Sordaria brevicollis]|uniref:Uncharacterized protein n=1 Tax=Sordaria brevicollis TaxID=83679 RepID=A0AAE0P2F8_SORBR|nr:hypothetical protein B0T20DRAFT_72086 [Sordaria brevicollis]